VTLRPFLLRETLRTCLGEPLLFLFEDTRNSRRALLGLGAYVLFIGGLMSQTPLRSHPLDTIESPQQALPMVRSSE
jgi:hypothetical protein